MPRAALAALLLATACVVPDVFTPSVPARAARIDLPRTRDSLLVDSELVMVPVIVDASERAIERPLTFATSAPAVASVDSTGHVRALAPGPVRITVTADSASATLALDVFAPIGRLVFKADTVAVPLDRLAPAPLDIIDTRGNHVSERGRVSYRSLDTMVATVDGSSLNGRNPGTAPIVASAGALADTIVARVYRWPASVVVTPPSQDVEVGTTFGAQADAYDSRGALLAHGGTPIPTGGIDTVGGQFFLRVADTHQFQVDAGAARGIADVTGYVGPATAVAAGDSACMLDRLARPVCWGALRVPALSDTAPLARFGKFSRAVMCGITSAGTARCWGSHQPWQPGTETFDVLASGANFTCGLRQQVATCAGANESGQLGDGTLVTRSAMTLVAGGHRLVDIAAGNASACGIDTAGVGWCWGSNIYAQLGDSSETGSLVPVRVAAPAGVRLTSIVAGPFHFCALDRDGSPWCWGYSFAGAAWTPPAGQGPCTNTYFCVRAPVPVPLTGMTSLVIANNATCAVSPAGQAWCWGLFGSSGRGGVTFLGGDGLAYVHFALWSGTILGVRADGTVIDTRASLPLLPSQR